MGPYWGLRDKHLNNSFHGTPVGSVIASKHPNIGVCKNIRLVSLSYMYPSWMPGNPGRWGYFSSSEHLISALDYATNPDSNMPIPIVNLSDRWYFDNSSSSDQRIQTMKQSIMNYPGLMVAGSGNEYRNNDNTYLSC
jgi:hypothetical protein